MLILAKIKNLLKVENIKNIAVILGGFSLVGVLILIIFAAATAGNVSTFDNVITVTGTAIEENVPRKVNFDMYVTTVNSNKAKAASELPSKLQKVMDEIKKSEILGLNVHVDPISIAQEEGSYNANGAYIQSSNWEASYKVALVLNDESKISDVTILLTTLDVKNVKGPTFVLDESKINKNELLARAMEDAKDKATKLAAQSGKKLGAVVSIEEGDSTFGSVYSNTSSSNNVPENSVSKTVTVKYKIK